MKGLPPIDQFVGLYPAQSLYERLCAIRSACHAKEAARLRRMDERAETRAQGAKERLRERCEAYKMGVG